VIDADVSDRDGREEGRALLGLVAARANGSGRMNESSILRAKDGVDHDLGDHVRPPRRNGRGMTLDGGRSPRATWRRDGSVIKSTSIDPESGRLPTALPPAIA